MKEVGIRRSGRPNTNRECGGRKLHREAIVIVTSSLISFGRIAASAFPLPGVGLAVCRLPESKNEQSPLSEWQIG